MCWVSFSIPMRAVGSFLGVLGYDFSIPVRAVGSFPGGQGIVFDTREGGGEFPWCAWVRFFIPVSAGVCIFVWCGLTPLWVGIVFDTREGGGEFPWYAWVRFFVPVRVRRSAKK